MVGGLLLLLDLLTLYFAYSNDSGKEPLSDNERICKLAWVGANAVANLAIIGLLLFMVLHLGFWGIGYDPVHAVMFACCANIVGFFPFAAYLLVSSLRGRQHQTLPTKYSNVESNGH